ncbi:uncharacterized protein MYCFIDRAFT_194837 [Pseudocercospora fijiensis CIRAD86]|uniref:DNA-(apurinic or apyrimidinic site) endonuclease 2 n=1 Tax=Pseudocercospora fijiensis (strain CIRAD86) TaxID=383855 RepID=M3A754_PSEFD|nr:uncharacterized protein MYCFIDRAFT_194837 [Pseudocercospora fijiensis CIRAD86]EME86919.1 hypothetical protein MYCFIDRAFT_194837 [Pseudocercospora fijiensis CIRAD86]
MCRNVNGIRNPFSYPPWNVSRTFSAMFDILESDIVVMQELKIQRKDLRDDMVLVDGWDCYFSLPKHKKGYSGVGIYTRNATCAPIRAEEGVLGVLPSANGTPYRDLPDEDSIGGYLTSVQMADIAEIGGEDPAGLDAEGRCVVVEFPAFVLFGVYSPANSNGLRDGFRHGFVCALDHRIRNLIKAGKNVILVGDLNVTRHEIDSGPTLEEMRKGLITHEDFISGPNRRIFNQQLIDGEVVGERDEGREKGVFWDTTRIFHPDRKGMYTHWDTKVNARPGNFGSRIDFVLVSEALRSWVKYGNIQEGLLGSDHCPVYIDFENEVTVNDGKIALLDIMNPPAVFVGGERKQEWTIASTPGFSAKRMPEFDKRRTIKSMFAAPALKKSQQPTPPGSVAQADDSQPAVETEGSTAPAKRKISVSTTPKEYPFKKQKSDIKTAPTKGQQSLKGFFQAKSVPITAAAQSAEKDLKNETEDTDSTAPNTGGVESNEDSETTEPPRTPSASQITADTDPSPRKFASKLASAEKSQHQWGALFSRPVAPLCEGHHEPCKTMLTKKKGSNQGRSFWMCARPLGPSGEKERGTQWRCGTFIWSSDWQAGKGKGVGAATGQGAGSPVKSTRTAI